MKKRNFMPWDDHSNLERHYCHPDERVWSNRLNITYCELCKDAKESAYFRKQTIQKEAKNER